MKMIILTGGGTAGHVTPNLALIPSLRKENFEIRYIGSYDGIEKSLVEDDGIPYDGISSGKLRRYFSLKNFTDPFRVIKGFGESKALLKRYQPDIVFSKGGFVAVPVVLAAKQLKIPVIIHESDLTPGLANRICIPAANKVCCNFHETLEYLPEDKAVLSGQPIREELFHGSKHAGLEFAGFTGEKPVIMVIGGSLGAVHVNNAIRAILPRLLERFDVIHICGKGHIDESLRDTPGYVQYEYIEDELKNLFAAADLIVSRAGANSICEIVALKKPNVLIPLPASASRGDQILNANSFKAQGYSAVLTEEEMTDDTLFDIITDTYDNRSKYVKAMAASHHTNAIKTIMGLIDEVTGEYSLDGN